MFVLLFFSKYLAMDMIRPLLTAGVPWLRLIQVINVHESECSVMNSTSPNFDTVN